MPLIKLEKAPMQMVERNEMEARASIINEIQLKTIEVETKLLRLTVTVYDATEEDVKRFN